MVWDDFRGAKYRESLVDFFCQLSCVDIGKGFLKDVDVESGKLEVLIR